MHLKPNNGIREIGIDIDLIKAHDDVFLWFFCCNQIKRSLPVAKASKVREDESKDERKRQPEQEQV